MEMVGAKLRLALRALLGSGKYSFGRGLLVLQESQQSMVAFTHLVIELTCSWL